MRYSTRVLTDDAPDTVLLLASGHSFAFAELLVAAELAGLLAPFLNRLARRYARIGEVEVDADTLQAALSAWRYDRALEAADEAKAWLARRAVTFDDLVDYLERVAVGEGEHTGEQDDVGNLVWAEAVCSGDIDAWMAVLAQRVSVRLRWEEEGRPDVSANVPPLPALTHAAALSDLEEWLREAEHVWRARLAPLLADTVLVAALNASPLTMMRLDVNRIALATPGAVAEARLCVAADKEPLARVARRARTTVDEQSRLAMDYPSDLQSRLVSARPGDILGPFSENGSFTLYQLAAKHGASLDDPLARRVIVERRTRDAFADLVSTTVSWPAWRP